MKLIFSIIIKTGNNGLYLLRSESFSNPLIISTTYPLLPFPAPNYFLPVYYNQLAPRYLPARDFMRVYESRGVKPSNAFFYILLRNGCTRAPGLATGWWVARFSIFPSIRLFPIRGQPSHWFFYFMGNDFHFSPYSPFHSRVCHHRKIWAENILPFSVLNCKTVYKRKESLTSYSPRFLLNWTLKMRGGMKDFYTHT